MHIENIWSKEHINVLLFEYLWWNNEGSHIVDLISSFTWTYRRTDCHTTTCNRLCTKWDEAQHGIVGWKGNIIWGLMKDFEWWYLFYGKVDYPLMKSFWVIAFQEKWLV